MPSFNSFCDLDYYKLSGYPIMIGMYNSPLDLTHRLYHWVIRNLVHLASYDSHAALGTIPGVGEGLRRRGAQYSAHVIRRPTWYKCGQPHAGLRAEVLRLGDEAARLSIPAILVFGPTM